MSVWTGVCVCMFMLNRLSILTETFLWELLIIFNKTRLAILFILKHLRNFSFKITKKSTSVYLRGIRDWVEAVVRFEIAQKVPKLNKFLDVEIKNKTLITAFNSHWLTCITAKCKAMRKTNSNEW